MEYYLDMQSEQRFFICSYREFDPHEKHCERTADYDVLLLMLGGVLRFTEDGKQTELHAGEYYFQRAFLHQSGDVESDLPFYFFIHFYGAYTGERTGLPLRGKFSPDVITADIDALIETFESPFSGYIDWSMCFYRILADLRRGGELKKAYNVANLAKNYLDSHYMGEFSLSKLEKQLNYSHDYIIRAFKREYGVTPYRYLTKKRVEYAKRQLSTTDAKISQIARDIGFSDDSGFYRAFFLETGETPINWKSGKHGEK